VVVGAAVVVVVVVIGETSQYVPMNPAGHWHMILAPLIKRHVPPFWQIDKPAGQGWIGGTVVVVVGAAVVVVVVVIGGISQYVPKKPVGH